MSAVRDAEAEKLLEDVGPGVSLGGMAGGQTSFQQYLIRRDAQAGLQATGSLTKQARSALRLIPDL